MAMAGIAPSTSLKPGHGAHPRMGTSRRNAAVPGCSSGAAGSMVPPCITRCRSAQSSTQLPSVATLSKDSLRSWHLTKTRLGKRRGSARKGWKKQISMGFEETRSSGVILKLKARVRLKIAYSANKARSWFGAFHPGTHPGEQTTT